MVPPHLDAFVSAKKGGRGAGVGAFLQRQIACVSCEFTLAVVRTLTASKRMEEKFWEYWDEPFNVVRRHRQRLAAINQGFK